MREISAGVPITDAMPPATIPRAALVIKFGALPSLKVYLLL